MAIRKLRVYADTSVFGGVFDDEFAEASTAFFDQVREGRFELLSSGIVRAEIEPAPDAVNSFFTEMLPYTRLADISVEAIHLREAYLQAGVVSSKARDDALHVALATVTDCWCIVSWNFKHIVHFQKIPLYNGVNASQGYPGLAIYSPHEVIDYEEKEV